MNFEDLQADFESHPIQGYLHTGEHLSVPLVSHIIDNLYVGGCKKGVELGDFFGRIVSLYKWERYAYDTENSQLYEYTMYDSPGAVDVETVELAASKALEALDAGQNVLIHCQAGINRSNLVAATVLKKLGYSAEDAIALLREKRSHLVLANKSFEEFLLKETHEQVDYPPGSLR